MSTKNLLTANFVQALNYYILVSGKTKKDIAEAIGVPPTTFSSWTKGKHLPDMDKLYTLSSYLNAPLTQFFHFTAITEPTDQLLLEIYDLCKQLPTEDKQLVRALVGRVLQLHTEK